LEVKDEGLNDKGYKGLKLKNISRIEGNLGFIKHLQRQMDQEAMHQNMNSNLEENWDVDQ